MSTRVRSRTRGETRMWPHWCIPFTVADAYSACFADTEVRMSSFVVSHRSDGSVFTLWSASHTVAVRAGDDVLDGRYDETGAARPRCALVPVGCTGVATTTTCSACACWCCCCWCACCCCCCCSCSGWYVPATHIAPPTACGAPAPTGLYVRLDGVGRAGMDNIGPVAGCRRGVANATPNDGGPVDGRGTAGAPAGACGACGASVCWTRIVCGCSSVMDVFSGRGGAALLLCPRCGDDVRPDVWNDSIGDDTACGTGDEGDALGGVGDAERTVGSVRAVESDTGASSCPPGALRCANGVPDCGRDEAGSTPAASAGTESTSGRRGLHEGAHCVRALLCAGRERCKPVRGIDRRTHRLLRSARAPSVGRCECADRRSP
jgi:hypothetical protein